MRLGKESISEEGISQHVPPGQIVTEKWPTLTFGATPVVDLESWSLEIKGLVMRPLRLGWQHLTRLPKRTVEADFRCVTGWSRLRNIWEGVAFRTLMEEAELKPQAAFASFECYGGYTTSLPLNALMDDDVLLAYSHDGAPLPREHGGPVRLIVPKRYAYKSAKWVHAIILLQHDQLGFWELRGYSNTADPWTDDRYSF